MVTYSIKMVFPDYSLKAIRSPSGFLAALPSDASVRCESFSGSTALDGNSLQDHWWISYLPILKFRQCNVGHYPLTLQLVIPVCSSPRNPGD